MRRVFIALPVSPAIEEKLISVQNNIKEIYPKSPIRWTASGNFHITLEFLGDLKDEEVNAVKSILEIVVPSYPGFEYSIDKIYGFPDIKKPKTIVVRPFDVERLSFKLRGDIHKQLVGAGLVENGRAWKPHLTLGRVKENWKVRGLDKVNVPEGSWKVNKVIFYESHLSGRGSNYEEIARYKLSNK